MTQQVFIESPKLDGEYIRAFPASDDGQMVVITHVYFCLKCPSDKPFFIRQWSGIVPHFKIAHDIELVFIPTNDDFGHLGCKEIYSYINPESKEKRCFLHFEEIGTEDELRHVMTARSRPEWR